MALQDTNEIPRDRFVSDFRESDVKAVSERQRSVERNHLLNSFAGVLSMATTMLSMSRRLGLRLRPVEPPARVPSEDFFQARKSATASGSFATP